MISTVPFDLSRVKKENLDMELLRAAIIAELDAVNLYEQLSALTNNAKIKAVFKDVSREEKTHVGEFQSLLLLLNKEQVKELEHGIKEVKELTEKTE